MKKFMGWLEKNVSPIMVKLDKIIYLKAVRNGMVAIVPLTIVGSFFLMLINIPIESIDALIAPYDAVLVIPFRLTVYMMAVYTAFAVGSAMGELRGLDSKTSGIIALTGFMMTIIPLTGTLVDSATFAETAVATVDQAEAMYTGWVLPYTYLGSAGVFGAMVVGIFSVEVLYFMKKKNMTVKMPDSVPQSVSDSFAALFPTFVVVIFIWFLTCIVGFNIHNFFTTLLSPFQDFLASNSLVGVWFTIILICLFWSAGIHGLSVVGAVIRPFWNIALAENSELIAQGVLASDLPNIVVEPFYQWFVWIGGAGATLGLLIAAAMFAKSQRLKVINKLAIIPGIFNINEPVIFGYPIVMNPILGIPFILAPLVLGTISYFACYFDLVNVPYLLAPWTLPAPIGAWMATGDWRSVVLVFILIAVSVVIYTPFLRLYDKQLLAEEVAADQVGEA